MAKCDICGKAPSFGIKVSHSHRRANKMWKPNIKRVKAVVNGTPVSYTHHKYKFAMQTIMQI